MTINAHPRVHPPGVVDQCAAPRDLLDALPTAEAMRAGAPFRIYCPACGGDELHVRALGKDAERWCANGCEDEVILAAFAAIDATDNDWSRE